MCLVGYPACLDRIIIIIVKYTPTSWKVMSVKRAQAHDQNDKKPRKKTTQVESHDLWSYCILSATVLSSILLGD